ncbi:hypothetical protein Cch01nite_31890 [Cellulomonas chitinilytica]|uniref:Uncharacterized protein n=1 Tax=Cellulomonas chitinilytica TaxID=398759 RepID=A0A919P4C4_9CELL|nr:hypothetical protein Cch01nite_31890 [Cellulomonas chitinilytica]
MGAPRPLAPWAVPRSARRVKGACGVAARGPAAPLDPPVTVVVAGAPLSRWWGKYAPTTEPADMVATMGRFPGYGGPMPAGSARTRVQTAREP